MDIELKCQNCLFFIPDKDKHGAVGTCMTNPPSVFPFPVRDIAGQTHIQWQSAPRPGVKDSEFCRHFQPRTDLVKTGEKHLEN